MVTFSKPLAVVVALLVEYSRPRPESEVRIQSLINFILPLCCQLPRKHENKDKRPRMAHLK